MDCNERPCTRKVRIISLLIILFPTVGFAQHHVSPVDSVKDVVVNLYNQGKANAIYDLSAPSFRQFISRNDFVKWLQTIRNKLGQVNHIRLVGKSKGFFIYKADFQNQTMNVSLAVNRLSKITGFAIRPALKKELVQSNNPLRYHIDSLADKAIRPYIQQINTVGIAVGILYHGKSYMYDYGETKKGDHQLPDENTLFEIGSITKTFTATLLAAFSLEGKCKLTDPVNKYLPASIPTLQKGGVSITLKTLAEHTSGLPRIPADLFTIKSFVLGDPYKNYDTTALFHYLDTVRLRSVPGKHFVYSNLGFGLLGTILERISGLSYQELIEKYICEPLKMNETRILLKEAQQTHFAKGYKANGKPSLHWHFRALAGCGAIRSSVSDMLKYLNAHLHADTYTALGKAILTCEQPAFDTKNGKIGMAWLIPDYPPGTYWHNGGTGGFRSYCAYNRDKQVAVVVLANSAISVDRIGVALMRELIKEK